MTEISTDVLLSRGRDREAVDKMAAALQAHADQRLEGEDMEACSSSTW